MTLLLALLPTALAADEPCDGHAFDQRVSSENFWVEWEDDTLTEAQAHALAQYAEEARTVFVDELGWPLTDRPIVYAVHPSPTEGFSGLAQTSVCDDGTIVPNIELWVGEYTEERARHLAAHELGHAAQYGYMGAYLDSVTSWLWWMEGTATWLATHVDGRVDFVADEVQLYLDNPHIGLHQGLTAHADATRAEHLYGTAVIAHFLETHVGGPDTVRDIWAQGGPLSGERIALPDVAKAAGLDFEAVWAEWLARATVADLDWGVELDRGAAILELVDDLPAQGGVDDELGPEGYGFAVVEFSRSTAGRNRALEVRFEGDPEVDWSVVLVRTNGSSPPGIVWSYVPLEVVDGVAEGWLSDFDGARAYLVASPLDLELVPHAFSWSADTIRDPGPMEATVVLAEPTGGCGCSASGAGFAGLAVLPLLVVRRRSTRR